MSRKVEDLIRHVVDPADFKMVVSNIGIVPDFSALYTTNAGPYTATIQVALNESHRSSSFEYMDRLRREIASQYPDLRTFFSSGSMVDAILNMGMPAPIDVQVSSRDLDAPTTPREDLAARIRKLSGIGEVYVPQDMNYPAVRLKVDRVHAAELGLTQKEIVDNVITALNSNTMIAPNYWVDHQTGNDYFLTVQYYENGQPSIHNFVDLTADSAAGAAPSKIDASRSYSRASSFIRAGQRSPSRLWEAWPVSISSSRPPRSIITRSSASPTSTSRLPARIWARFRRRSRKLLDEQKFRRQIRINLRGMVQGMNESFTSFAIGLSLSVVLLFLILVAQFRSFKDPFLIMLAIPMGFIGVLVVLPLTHTTLNVMSLMGVLMLVGIAASNSILIVEFAHRLEEQGRSVEDAVITSCRVRLRPILMTSLATIIGMVPMALKLGTGSEQYAPLARAIIGGLTVSVLLTVFIVPAAYLLVYRSGGPQPAE